MKRYLCFAVPFVLSCVLSHAGSASAADPCAIVDRKEAGQALQATVTAVAARDMGSHVSCSFRTASIGKRLVVTIIRFDSAEEAKSEFGTSISSPLHAVTPSVSLHGIGDGAQRLGPSIYAVKGAVLYVFTPLEKDGNGAGAQRTIALARSTLARVR